MADFKSIVETEIKRIANNYIDIVKGKGEDEAFIQICDQAVNSYFNSLVNYIMNDLVEKKIYGGDDSLMYPLIHDFVVDKLFNEEIEDKWSNQIGRGNASSAPKQEKKIDENALREKIKKEIEADYRAELKAQAEEAKRIKEEEKARIKAEKEALKKAEEDKASNQTSLFDFL